MRFQFFEAITRIKEQRSRRRAPLSVSVATTVTLLCSPCVGGQPCLTSGLPPGRLLNHMAGYKHSFHQQNVSSLFAPRLLTCCRGRPRYPSTQRSSSVPHGSAQTWRLSLCRSPAWLCLPKSRPVLQSLTKVLVTCYIHEIRRSRSFGEQQAVQICKRVQTPITFLLTRSWATSQ